MDINSRISQIEEEIRITPYHKGTEHHIGKLKAKIAKLREEFSQKKLKSSGGRGGYAVKKTGDATVVLVGPPSVGKSTLINQITNVNSKVAAYDFTTVDVIPGMMDYKSAKIQIFDIPGIIAGAAQGKGRGKQVLSVIRTADLILIMVDVKTVEKIPQIKNELYEFGIRLDEEKPKIVIKKTFEGGIKVISTCQQIHLNLSTVKELAQEFKIRNGEVHIKENITLDRLIDALMGNRIYLPYLIVVNKIDITPISDKNNFILISAQKGLGIEELKEKIWQKLGLMRIYLQSHEYPLIVKKGQSLRQILNKISISNKKSVKSASISGPGAKYPNQEVSLNFLPQEGTKVTFVGTWADNFRTFSLGI